MLRTRVGGLPLECCVYNASGPRSGTVEALTKVGASRSGAVTSKSATVLPQEGNPHPRYKALPLGGSLNSEGLPNKGIGFYLAPEAVQSAGDKPYIVSLSGKCLEDNLEMLQRALGTEGVAGVELNLACPNVVGKPIIAYDFAQMEQVLEAVAAVPGFGAKCAAPCWPPPASRSLWAGRWASSCRRTSTGRTLMRRRRC